MSGRGRGRGRGAAAAAATASNLETADFSANLEDTDKPEAVAAAPKPKRQTKSASPSVEEYKANMQSIKSRLSVIIDALDGDDNEASMKRNVAMAVKHLKQIHDML
jgi:hypothetical protein